MASNRAIARWARWLLFFFQLWPLAGVPIVNVPVGFDNAGRPMGMQLIGRVGEDQRVLEFAMGYEAVTDHLEQRPKLKEKA